MACEHGWHSETDCDVCTARRVAPALIDRIAELEDELAEASAQIASHIATCKAYTDVAVAAEREACAKIAERPLVVTNVDAAAGRTVNQMIADRIRARHS
jgi:hypothetical protein